MIAKGMLPTFLMN